MVEKFYLPHRGRSRLSTYSIKPSDSAPIYTETFKIQLLLEFHIHHSDFFRQLFLLFFTVIQLFYSVFNCHLSFSRGGFLPLHLKGLPKTCLKSNLPCLEVQGMLIGFICHQLPVFLTPSVYLYFFHRAMRSSC